MLRALLILLVCCPVFAEETPPPPKGRLVREGFNPPYVIWEDGRKAVLKYKEIGLRTVDTRLALVEDLCETELSDPECTFSYSVRPRVYTGVWENHPDSAKIGQVILNQEGKPAIRSPLLFDDYKIYKQSWPPGKYKYHELTCRNDLFFDKVRSSSGDIKVAMWSSEFNLPNAETFVAENQTISGAYGVKLVRTSPGKYVLQSAESLFSYLLPPFFGQVSYWSIEKSNGEMCDVKFTQAAVSADGVNKELEETPLTDLQDAGPADINTDTNGTIYSLDSLKEEAGLQ
jgi:hypothetical protein